ncbi:hypothetical protein MUN78_03635 [Leucobacter allii]|uniref:Uncharacterized protein n=1 Tax=Leucobacter allii TaxID=2932247 RepID=A0ABY4FNS5_9MICO|nr:hypothetical protein [Leucobacter allii]UOQ57943.1 hypothetical protein MUN78_03635 [Leucobacter allii]UOR02577.1 hypothetical protein MUN77_04520 [Leucobacter allii]
MTSGPRRGVTRGYVGGLIVAALIVAAALVVAVWGLLALGLAREPVASETPIWAAPLILALALGALAWALWRQAIALLRGRRAPAWGLVVAASLGAYAIWSLAGLGAGMRVEETWLSPFAAALVPIWAVAALLFWAVLGRRVYTDRPPPRWPWERDEDGDA